MSIFHDFDLVNIHTQKKWIDICLLSPIQILSTTTIPGHCGILKYSLQNEVATIPSGSALTESSCSLLFKKDFDGIDTNRGRRVVLVF